MTVVKEVRAALWLLCCALSDVAAVHAVRAMLCCALPDVAAVHAVVSPSLGWCGQQICSKDLVMS